jgi:hypothetical protein
MTANRSFVVSFIAGALGGGLVTGVVLVASAVSGRLGPSTKTVVVQGAPAVPGTASQRTRGLTVHDIYERDAPGVVFVNATGVSVA